MKNQIIKSDLVYHSKHSWLDSRHIFSFGDYFDPKNMGFGNMRVFNDDYIDAKNGFGMHPHNNMEILTIMLEGELTHSDSMGNTEVIKKGEIQTMSTGTGIFHSEKNLSDEQTHSYQLWFLPNNYNSKPRYKDQSISLVKNNLNLLASNNLDDNVGYIDTNSLVYRGIFDENQKFDYNLDSGKGLFIYVTSGELLIDGKKLKEKDQLRYIEKGLYNFSVSEKSDFILIEVEL